MATRLDDNYLKYGITCERHNGLDFTRRPATSTARAWKELWANSNPIFVTLCFMCAFLFAIANKVTVWVTGGVHTDLSSVSENPTNLYASILRFPH